MTNDEIHENADLLLQYIRSGKKLNNNQNEMLLALGAHPDRPDNEIQAVLIKQIKNHAPSHCTIPEPDEGY